MNIFEAFATYAKKDWTNFNMSNNWLGTVKDFGSLNAIYFDNVIAGDTWKMAHNVITKLPPLVAPAFTRIKGVINSYYVSYASVWKHWNSFISDKPEDNYMNRALLNAYKGRFVEPCVCADLISVICKIAYGNFTVNDVSEESPFLISLKYYKTDADVSFDTVNYKSILTWTTDSQGLRKIDIQDNSVGEFSEDSFDINETSTALRDAILPTKDDIADSASYTYPDGRSYTETNYSLGYADYISVLVSACQSVVRNLENHGVPCNLMAASSFSYYRGKLFNLLPFIAESSVWENFYRDVQNQSPEFDYSEVNGLITPQAFAPQIFIDKRMFEGCAGWKIRMDCFPLGVSSSPIFYSVENLSDAFCLLTGFCLRRKSLQKLALNLSSNVNSILFPSHYNGLLVTKYRNFEKDYFTSASVDPMQGVAQVNVPATIEALRTASKLEEFLERSASARDFYNFMKYNFGTSPESTRYKKPILLGTKIIPIQIGEQLQTSQTTETSPLGERAGVADGYGNGGTCDHYFNEHGIVVSYLSFVVDAQYMQGLPHYFEHHLQFDYPFPDFANLGAESIKLSEIYFGDIVNGSAQLGKDSGDLIQAHNLDGSSAAGSIALNVNSPSDDYISGYNRTTDSDKVTRVFNNPDANSGISYSTAYSDVAHYEVMGDYNDSGYFSNSVFGYVPRYSKWKWHPDVVAGQMRTNMDYWHTFRKFSQCPKISHSFVSYEDAGYVSDLNRIFAVMNDNADKYYIDIFNNCSVRRCLPLVASPSLD